MPNRPIRPVQPRPVQPGAGIGLRPDPTAPVSPAPARPRPADGPTLAVNFTVDTEAGPLSLSRVEGLGLAADPDRVQRTRGGAGEPPMRWAAPALPGRLTLTRAVDGDRSLYAWRREALDGKPAMRTLTIRQLDRSASVTLNVWRIEDAWPLAWRGPLFDAIHGGIAFEALDIVHADVIWL